MISKSNIWRALDTYVIPVCLERAMQSTYMVYKGKLNTQMVGGKVGVRQVSIQLRLFFIVNMDLIINKILHDINDNTVYCHVQMASSIAATKE